MNQMCPQDLYNAAATNPWAAYSYPQYQFGPTPYSAGMVDISSFGGK